MQGPSRDPDFVGPYEVIGHLGAGGLGNVFLCKDPHTGSVIAVKRLIGSSDLPEIIIQRMEREATLLSSVRHPNIIRVHDFGWDKEGVYFALEYIEGIPLSRALDSGQVDMPLFYRVATQCLEGLAAAHRQRILHLDIKPANIMLKKFPSPNFTVKLLDFGLARFADEFGKTDDELTIGSVYYIAPEQLTHEDIDERADLYSLGQVCYHMLTGNVAFPDPDPVNVRQSHLTSVPARIETLNPSCPKNVANWVHEMIARSPSSRPASAQEALNRLLRGAINRPSAPISIGSPKPPKALEDGFKKTTSAWMSKITDKFKFNG